MSKKKRKKNNREQAFPAPETLAVQEQLEEQGDAPQETFAALNSSPGGGRGEGARKARKGAYLYVTLSAIAFLALAVVFDTLPRSTVSELEKRELAEFPAFTWDRLWSGDFTREVSSWFSDTEPFRDEIMTFSMTIKGMQALVLSEDNVKFHAAEAEEAPVEEAPHDERVAEEFKGEGIEDGNAKIAHAGIMIVGSGDKVRALMAYGGGPNGGVQYAEAANAYKRALGPDVNVYAMVVPIAAAYYCPEKMKGHSKDQRLTINNIYAHLDPDVKAVDVYTVLGRHASEDIYLRTDHHWSPLGAYYAAEHFAEIAGVPFRTLRDGYRSDTVHRFVGSMYGYSRDIAVKRAPEDFIFYRPTQVAYETTYVDYKVDKSFNVTHESGPVKSKYFFDFKDGSGAAYCTFMGSDQRLTKVVTGTPGPRRVLILKDSFGNALPGYLFYSFEEVHVIDFRYNSRNIQKYVRDNHITDVLFAFNIFNAYGTAGPRLKKYL
ncbi:MAG: hypothetical protein IJ692_03585 [Alloprevotella sp.]|nr:hypothetical protein [Alloprevotella sp.]